MKPKLVSYATALQRETKNGPTIKNVATPRQSKHPCVVLYGANNNFPPIGGKTEKSTTRNYNSNS